MFYQGGPIDHCTHVPVPVSQYSVESEYNAACTVGMSLAHFSMINNELLNKDPDLVPEKSPLIIFYIKSYICLDNNGKYTKHIRNISRIINFVRNGEDYNLHKILWFEGGLQMADILTKNVREDKFNHILGYDIVRLDYWHNTIQRGVTGYRRV